MHTFDESEEQMIKPRLFTARIIVMAIITGELVFCVIAIYIRLAKELSSSSDYVSTWPWIAASFCIITLSSLVGVLHIIKMKVLTPEQSLESFLKKFFTFDVIIPQAVCEAPAFLCMVTVLLGAKFQFILPIFALIVLVPLWMFPTRSRFENLYTQAQERRALQQARIE